MNIAKKSRGDQSNTNRVQSAKKRCSLNKYRKAEEAQKCLQEDKQRLREQSNEDRAKRARIRGSSLSSTGVLSRIFTWFRLFKNRNHSLFNR